MLGKSAFRTRTLAVRAYTDDIRSEKQSPEQCHLSTEYEDAFRTCVLVVVRYQ